MGGGVFQNIPLPFCVFLNYFNYQLATRFFRKVSHDRQSVCGSRSNASVQNKREPVVFKRVNVALSPRMYWPNCVGNPVTSSPNLKWYVIGLVQVISGVCSVYSSTWWEMKRDLLALKERENTPRHFTNHHRPLPPMPEAVIMTTTITHVPNV